MKDKAILFLSHLFPRECYDEVNANSKNNMQDAANALQWNLIEGLSHHLNGCFDIINLLPIASFPQYYKKAYIRSQYFDGGVCRDGISIGFNNIKLIRRVSIYTNLYYNVSRWCNANKAKDRTIIVYTLNPTMLGVLKKIKKHHTNISVCAIVADLPDMMNLSSKMGPLRLIAKKLSSKSAYNNVKIIDKFVLLTAQMAEYLKTDKPYCVMEGIATAACTEAIGSDDTAKKTVLYTGTLHKKFGVVHLLEAFKKINDNNYRLVICGVGDSEKIITEAALLDQRIIFKGKCSRDEVLQLQSQATVLINPRMNIEEFTKYSFPSKNLEYLASGVPLIAYKLDGIPDEYDKYINYVPDNDVQSLADMIHKICELPLEKRQEQGRQARQFVLKNKNAVAQTQKIMELLFSD